MPRDLIIALVAQFHVTPRRRLDLWSLTVFEKKIGHDRKSYTARSEYDVELSKKFGYIFDQSGFGGDRSVEVSGPYFALGDIDIIETPTTLIDPTDSPPWAGPGTAAIRARNRTRRMKGLPRPFSGYGNNVLEWLLRNGIEEDAVYCSECGDSMPATGYDYCEHVWWCDKTGWYSTPDERCGCKTKRECDDDAE